MNNEDKIEELNKLIDVKDAQLLEKDDQIWKLKKELEYKNRMLAVLADLIKATLDK